MYIAIRSIGRLCNCKQTTAIMARCFAANSLLLPQIHLLSLFLPSIRCEQAHVWMFLKWQWLNNFFSETSLQTLLAYQMNNNNNINIKNHHVCSHTAQHNKNNDDEQMNHRIELSISNKTHCN